MMAKRRKKYFDRGKWQVERERHHIANRTPPDDFNVRSMADAVSGVLKSMNLQERAWEQDFAREWPGIVGAQVAKHTRPGRLYKGLLTVFVTHSTWLSELERFGKDQMLTNLQKRFGRDRIREIRLQLDPD